MIASVYLSNAKINIAIGRLSLNPSFYRILIKKYLSFPIPNKIYADGVISNPLAFSEFLRKLWADNNLPKGVSLVLNRSRFITKLFDMPLLSVSKTIGYLPREFYDVARSKEPVFSYYSISKNAAVRQRRVLGVMTEKGYLQRTTEVFDKAGLTLVSIENVQNAVVRLLSKHPGISGRTCLVQCVEDDELTSYLFIGGLYAYSSRSRAARGGNAGKYDPGALAAEVTRSVSGILQFVRAQDTERPVTEVYLLGLGKDDYELCKESIGGLSPLLTVDKLSGEPLIHEIEKIEGSVPNAAGTASGGEAKASEVSFGELLCPASGFDHSSGKANLLYQRKRDLKKEEKRGRLIKIAAPFIITVGLFSLWALKLYGERMELRALADKTAEYLDGEGLKRALALYDAYSAELADTEARAAAAEKAGAALDSYPLMNSTIKDALEQSALGYADVAVVSYDASSGLVGLSCTSDDETLIHRYIEALKSKAVLIKVEYTGYDIGEDGSYKVNLSCYLAPEAGRATADKGRDGGPDGGPGLSLFASGTEDDSAW